MIKWLKGLLSAMIGGAFSGVVIGVVDPQNFNWEQGKTQLGMICFLLGLSHAAMYVKNSPFPTGPWRECKDENGKVTIEGEEKK